MPYKAENWLVLSHKQYFYTFLKCRFLNICHCDFKGIRFLEHSIAESHTGIKDLFITINDCKCCQLGYYECKLLFNPVTWVYKQGGIAWYVFYGLTWYGLW